jgi:hypothetical protein
MEHARREAAEAEAPADLLERLSSPDRATAITTYWQWRLERMERARRERFISPDQLAHIHMALGQPDSAIEDLEAAFEARTGWLVPFLTVDPLFDGLRGDPRFEDLLSRVSTVGAVPLTSVSVSSRLVSKSAG